MLGTDWVDQTCFAPINYFVDPHQKCLAKINYLFGNENHLLRQKLQVLTSWSLLRSKMRILGRHATVKVTKLSMTPLSRTQSLLHLSILVLKTDTIPLQFSRVGLPEAAFTCHSQLGKGYKNN
uniref:Uncharacterized protein n=2 Tax=Lygus hesperus TaxID=30085 RepID=A0A0K8THL8_LYGHE